MPKNQITQLKNGQKIQTNISPKTHRWPKAHEKIFNITYQRIAN